MAKVAIICALAEEAAALYKGKGREETLRHMPLRRHADHGHDIAIATCGLGKVNAAMAATLAAADGAEMVLMSGTCGRIGAVEAGAFWIAEALQHDYGAEIPGDFVHYSAGAFPIGEARITPFTAMADPGLGLPHARIASGDRFIGCPDRARFIADGLSADLVDMEVAAMAQAAYALGVPWAAIKASSDDANDASGGDFQANLNAASERAAKAMEGLVELL